MPEFKLPDVGEGLTEAEIVEWKVAVGDVVEVNDILVDIETAKSVVELPSPFAGEVTAILVEAGQTVQVGTPIIAIGEPAAAPAPAAQPPEPAKQPEIDLSNPAAGGLGEGESLVGRAMVERGSARRPRVAARDVDPGDRPAPVAAERPAPAAVAEIPDRDVRVLAKPPVRKLAKDLGIDLRTLTPTGPNGTVSRADVEQAVGTAPAPVPAALNRSTGSGDRETREPIKGVRKAMGEAMVASAFTAPHVTEWVTVDVTRTVELVERLAARREFRDLRVSPLLVLARAAVLAMRRTPIINSTWDDAAGEVVIKHYVNLGIAAATPRGLVVPNIKDAQDLTLPDLAAALNALVTTAREGRTQPAEMSGGTFTITNVGVFGVDGGTPIINPGESAILCFGAIKRQPWVVGEQIVPRDVCTLTLSFDHRHVDGEAGSKYLADVAGILEDPATALLF